MKRDFVVLLFIRTFFLCLTCIKVVLDDVLLSLSQLPMASILYILFIIPFKRITNLMWRMHYFEWNVLSFFFMIFISIITIWQISRSFALIWSDEEKKKTIIISGGDIRQIKKNDVLQTDRIIGCTHKPPPPSDSKVVFGLQNRPWTVWLFYRHRRGQFDSCKQEGSTCSRRDRVCNDDNNSSGRTCTIIICILSIEPGNMQSCSHICPSQQPTISQQIERERERILKKPLVILRIVSFSICIYIHSFIQTHWMMEWYARFCFLSAPFLYSFLVLVRRKILSSICVCAEE